MFHIYIYIYIYIDVYHIIAHTISVHIFQKQLSTFFLLQMSTFHTLCKSINTLWMYSKICMIESLKVIKELCITVSYKFDVGYRM